MGLPDVTLGAHFAMTKAGINRSRLLCFMNNVHLQSYDPSSMTDNAISTISFDMKLSDVSRSNKLITSEFMHMLPHV
jgi:hypothetical protein